VCRLSSTCTGTRTGASTSTGTSTGTSTSTSVSRVCHTRTCGACTVRLQRRQIAKGGGRDEGRSCGGISQSGLFHNVEEVEHALRGAPRVAIVKRNRDGASTRRDEAASRVVTRMRGAELGENVNTSHYHHADSPPRVLCEAFGSMHFSGDTVRVAGLERHRE